MGDDEEVGYDDDEDDKPPETSQETTDNAGTECDDETTDDDSEQGKDYDGQFNDDFTIYQDNKSTILLSENGKGSSIRRTKHLYVHYFLVTDRIKRGEVKVAYCPTKNMLADFFTKPLQGAAFKWMHSIILNMPSIDKVNEAHRSLLGKARK